MIILRRRVNESIVIDSTIQIHVLRINSGKVKLGVSAPQSVPVQREEILRQFRASDDGTSCSIRGGAEK
jgi:carbon storage regulator